MQFAVKNALARRSISALTFPGPTGLAGSPVPQLTLRAVWL